MIPKSKRDVMRRTMTPPPHDLLDHADEQDERFALALERAEGFAPGCAAHILQAMPKEWRPAVVTGITTGHTGPGGAA